MTVLLEAICVVEFEYNLSAELLAVDSFEVIRKYPRGRIVPDKLATKIAGVALKLAVLLSSLQFARFIVAAVGLYSSTNSSLAVDPAV